MTACSSKRVFDVPPVGRRALAARLGSGVLVAVALSAEAGCMPTVDAVRAQAASDFQCSPFYVKVRSLGPSRYVATGCDQYDQYTCAQEWSHGASEEVCERDPEVVHPSPFAKAAAPTASPPAQLRRPPSGAGGFAFGATETDVRQACESAGHEYHSVARGLGSCDGVAAQVGAPARATMTYCAGILCSVSLQVEPTAGEALGRELVRWRAALEGKYGGPAAAQANVPSTCRDDVTPCLLDRTASLRFDWQWGQGRRVSLSTRVDGVSKPAIVIACTGPPLDASKAPGL